MSSRVVSVPQPNTATQSPLSLLQDPGYGVETFSGIHNFSF